MIKLKTLILGGIGLIWWLTKPKRRDRDMLAWRGNFAHRGLHDKQAPENTRAAFQRALDRGYGFEFDVQLTKDDKLVVHHDFDGRRSFGSDVRLDQLSLEELRNKKLFGTDETIMTLDELLDLIGGRVGLILEIKAEHNTEHISQLVAEKLDKYIGEVVIESFHPLVLYWFRRHRPHLIRGQLAYDSFSVEPMIINFCLSHYLFNFLARPHFVAYSYGDRYSLGLWLQHWLHRTPMVAYTVKNQQDHRIAQEMFPTIIFEQYLPEEL